MKNKDNVKQFDFWKNWINFSKNKLDSEKYSQAIGSLDDFIWKENIIDKTVIDIWCWSWIFSMWFLALWAKKVLWLDVNENSLIATKLNYDNYSNNGGLLTTKFASILDEKDLLDIEQYDIVYSRWVLHHTWNMYKAFDNSSSLVKKWWYLCIAIYNKHWSSPIWRIIKKLYLESPKIIKKLFIFIFYPIIFIAKFLVTLENPFKKERWMNFYYDVIDWIWWYPYEYASVSEIEKYFVERWFELKKVKKSSTPTWCNDFLFYKK